MDSLPLTSSFKAADEYKWLSLQNKFFSINIKKQKR